MSKHILYFITAALLLASCSASKHLAGQYPLLNPDKEVVTARVAMEIEGEDVSPTGRLRMQRDEVVQLNLVMMGMNIATLEFTPDSVLLVDRFNKQYVHARYEEIKALREREIGFAAVQALFWGDDMRGREEGPFSWTYTAVGSINKHKIPSGHKVRFIQGNRKAGFDMMLSEFGNDRKWSPRTVVDAENYSKRDPNILFNALISL